MKELERLPEDLLMKDVASAGLDRATDVEFLKRVWLKHQTKCLHLLKEVRDHRVEIDKLTYSARKHLQIFSKVRGRETDAGSSGYISQSRTDLSQIRFHTSATQRPTQNTELGSQHQESNGVNAYTGPEGRPSVSQTIDGVP